MFADADKFDQTTTVVGKKEASMEKIKFPNMLLINQISHITRLNKDEVEELLTLGVDKKIKKKKKLARPERIVNKAYFLKSGIIRHYVVRDNQEFTKNLIKGPRFMLPSLTNFFLNTPSQIYCESLTELEVIEWSREELFHFADNHIKFYKFLLQAVVKAFHGKEVKEIALNQLDAKQRYLNFLEDFPNLVNEIPIQYIASYLGIRPETLSRIRAKLIS